MKNLNPLHWLATFASGCVMKMVSVAVDPDAKPLSFIACQALILQGDGIDFEIFYGELVVTGTGGTILAVGPGPLVVEFSDEIQRASTQGTL